jgi:hypothetical protein
MAETIVSPGVLAIENDQSFITQQPIQVGSVIVGPTVKGPVGIPTVVTSYSDYLNRFGATFLSESQTYSYFTSIAAYNYFNNGGTSLLITRVVNGDFTPATSSTIPTSTAATSASVNLNLTYVSASVASVGSSSFGINGITFYFTGSTVANTPTTVYVNTSSFASSTINDYVVTSSTIFNASSSATSYSGSLQYISSNASSPNIVFTYIGSNGLTGNLQYVTSGSTTTYFSGGTNTEAFVLETLSEGEIMNSDGTLYANGTLENGTPNNVRWQIVSPNVNNGTFSLIIRQGNDSSLTPSILETFGNLSLDPLASNYIEKVIGNQYETVEEDNGEYYTQLNGDYPNKSRYVRVKQVNAPTPNYFDNTGNPKPQYTGSIPTVSNGAFGGALGNIVSPTLSGSYYENITNESIQGISPSDYTSSISLLANKDAYRYNLLIAPGLIADENFYPDHFPVISQMITTVQNRGDSMTVIDLVGYGSPILPVLSNALSFDTSYAAAYWPWVQTVDPNISRQTWTPASTLIPGVYALNDSLANPWSAPAGTQRGVLTSAIRAERYLTQGNRDDLYENNINSIATFPNTGVVVFGQKTLQKKQSALDRINVRRLLIELKGYISQIADTLVFEPNNIVTRNNFLSQVNPYLASVQQRNGLTSYKVIMDESNNTPTVIDNNQLIGQIYLQPTRTAEFIILDFNILPTGATFPS